MSGIYKLAVNLGKKQFSKLHFHDWQMNGRSLEKLCTEVIRELDHHAMVMVELGFLDRQGIVFQSLVNRIGEAEEHDSYGLKVWDIKYDERLDQNKVARSLTMREFPMHTDAAFDEPPPKYVGLYAIQEDRLGGGISHILDGHKILARLSGQSRHILLNQKFVLRVPEEFRKGSSTVEIEILDFNWNFRYRRELIIDEACTQEQLIALEELEKLIYGSKSQESFLLRSGSMILFDNGRFLHARSQVRDRERHLLRMRFQAKWQSPAWTDNTSAALAMRSA